MTLVASSVIAFFKAIVELLDVEVFHCSFRFVFCAGYFVLTSYLLIPLFQMLRDQLVAIRDGENIVEAVVHTRVRHFQPNFVSPYDRGVYGNWKALMGEDPIEWFLPLRKKATFTSEAYAPKLGTARPKPFYAGIH